MTTTAKTLRLALAALAAATFAATAEARSPVPAHGRYTSLHERVTRDPVVAAPNRFEVEDSDGGNATNPALPPYARGRGQETGGPARDLIPN